MLQVLRLCSDQLCSSQNCRHLTLLQVLCGRVFPCWLCCRQLERLSMCSGCIVQVAVLVLHHINHNLISTRPTSQPHRLPAVSTNSPTALSLFCVFMDYMAAEHHVPGIMCMTHFKKFLTWVLGGFPQGAVVRFVEGIQEEGSYGKVLEAVVNLRCAAKMAIGPAGQAQLENEAAVLATIPPHKNIVHVYGMAPAPEDDEDVLLMELAEEDLFRYHRCAPAHSSLAAVTPLDCQALAAQLLCPAPERVCMAWRSMDGCASQACSLPSGFPKSSCFGGDLRELLELRLTVSCLHAVRRSA